MEETVDRVTRGARFLSRFSNRIPKVYRRRNRGALNAVTSVVRRSLATSQKSQIRGRTTPECKRAAEDSFHLAPVPFKFETRTA